MMKSILRLRWIEVGILLASAVLFLGPERVSAYDLDDWEGRWIIYRSGNQQPLTLTINDPLRGDCLSTDCWREYKVAIINRDGSSTGTGKIVGMVRSNSHAVINIPSADGRSIIRYDAHLYRAKVVISGTYQKKGTNWVSHFCAFKQRR